LFLFLFPIVTPPDFPLPFYITFIYSFNKENSPRARKKKGGEKGGKKNTGRNKKCPFFCDVDRRHAALFMYLFV
jgi:hypothetical protein